MIFTLSWVVWTGISSLVVRELQSHTQQSSDREAILYEMSNCSYLYA